MCKNCKATHIQPDKILEKPCEAIGNDGFHALLKRAVMCQHCDALSDCPSTFAQEPCPGLANKLELGGPPSNPLPKTKPATEKVPAGSAPSMPAAKRAKLDMELMLAAKEMARLVVLKGLQTESLEMQRLLALKHQAKTGENGTVAALVRTTLHPPKLNNLRCMIKT